ncbi:MAG: YdeI/OmpD-associated family protein [Owenweeksia sp.]
MNGARKYVFIASIQHDATHGGAWIEVPFDVKKAFDSSRPRVKAIFDGIVTYRGTLVRMKSKTHIIAIRKDIRKALNKNPGDDVEVELTLDTEPRTLDIPDILMEAFQKHPEIEAYFQNLAYTHKREHIEYVLSAKKEETRLRRTQKTMETLFQQLKK